MVGEENKRNFKKQVTASGFFYHTRRTSISYSRFRNFTDPSRTVKIVISLYSSMLQRTDSNEPR